jgi:hypothetical protein
VRGSVELVDVDVVHSFSWKWEKEVGLIVTKMIVRVRNKGKL